MLRCFFLTLMLALSACQTSSEVLKDVPWQYQKFNEHNYQRLSIDSVSDKLVKRVMKNYKYNPSQEQYSEIGLIKVLQDEKTHKKYLKFSISYVSDIYVVYEVTENDSLSDKFLLSQW